MEDSEKAARHNARLIKEEESRMKNAKKIAQRDAKLVIEFINPDKITSPEDLKEKLKKCLNVAENRVEEYKPRPPTSLID